VRDYVNRYYRPLLRIGGALLVLGILNYIFTEHLQVLFAALLPLLTGLMLKVFPVARVGVDQIEIHRGILRSKIVIPFSAVRGIDESHSKFVRLSTDDDDLRISTAVLSKGERDSLIDDLRMGAKQARATSARPLGNPGKDV
jgi:hypothetical protein